MMAVATVVPVPLNSLIVVSRTRASPTLSQHQRARPSASPASRATTRSTTTMLKTAGLSAGDVTKVNVGFNLVPSILSNKVDAIIGGYHNVEAIQIEQETGKKPTVFPANELGVPNYAELVLVANSDKLSSDPAYADAVTRLRGGARQGDGRGHRRPGRRHRRHEGGDAVRRRSSSTRASRTR